MGNIMDEDREKFTKQRPHLESTVNDQGAKIYNLEKDK